MPCTKCRVEFTVLNWKFKCGECEDKYCTKCMKKREGVLYCEKCVILLKRPPDRLKLMELKPKDLQDYLNKHNISTYGLVEKQELVDLFCKKHIPERPKRGFEKLTANFPGSLSNNIRPQNFFDYFENIEPNVRTSTTNRVPLRRPPRPQRPPPASPTTSPPPSTSPPLYPRTPTFSAPPDPQPTTSSTRRESPEETPKKSQNETADSSPLPPKYPKLSDFDNPDELGGLSSKELKQLLTINRVNFKGCVEKTELLERAQRLWQDNHELKKDLPENVQDLCKLCMDAPLDCVLLECGHIATCIDCGKKLAECPICRQYVSRVVRTFKA